MKMFTLACVAAGFMVGCGEKKEDEAASTSTATMPDGTEVALDANHLYSESKCEVDNVDTSTFRKSYVSLSGDKIYTWDVVFFNEACDVAQDHVVFGTPFSIAMQNFDGSTGTVDGDGDQQPDVDITVSDEQLVTKPRDPEAEGLTYTKETAPFSLARVFDFSIELSPPTVSTDKLELVFKIALLSDDLLVDDVSYLKHVYADVTCLLANKVYVDAYLPNPGKFESLLDGAGTYTASATLNNVQKGQAVKSCEVIIDRIYQRTGGGTWGTEIKSSKLEIP